MSIRIFVILTAILLVVLTGSTGYYLLFGGKHTFMDCLYMTVISLTTVGYGEVLEISGNIPAQIFSMILIIFGTGIILYGISTLTALIVEGEVSGILRRKRMKKRIHQIDISPHSDFTRKTMTLTEGTTLMVMGNVETIKKVRDSA